MDLNNIFLFQFQAFSHFRAKLTKKTENDLMALKDNPKVGAIK